MRIGGFRTSKFDGSYISFSRSLHFNRLLFGERASSSTFFTFTINCRCLYLRNDLNSHSTPSSLSPLSTGIFCTAGTRFFFNSIQYLMDSTALGLLGSLN
ncbi:unnamed protein product [Citrullus colocynthis]|uniref:Uncharacterized protein n=1 Tax=Citrullus colocynthis TaxID=252529 RepID=A0ABP0ZBS8_9ROSI